MPTLEQKKEVYEIYLGTSRKEQLFEIQLHRDGKIQVAYRTIGNTSSILSADTANTLNFGTIGALPVPKLLVYLKRRRLVANLTLSTSLVAFPTNMKSWASLGASGASGFFSKNSLAVFRKPLKSESLR